VWGGASNVAFKPGSGKGLKTAKKLSVCSVYYRRISKIQSRIFEEGSNNKNGDE